MVRKYEKLHDDFEPLRSWPGEFWHWASSGMRNQKLNLWIGLSFATGLLTGIYITIKVLGV